VKDKLRILFSPLLKILESGTEPFTYKSSDRTILMIMGGLFSGLAMLVFWFARGQDPVYLLPVLIFGSVGVLSFMVGFIGTDRAVAKIWGSRR